MDNEYEVYGRIPSKDKSLVDIKDEIWKDIPDFYGMYSVSNYGRVRSNARYNDRGHWIKSKILSQSFRKPKGYIVGIMKNGKRYTRTVMYLVGITFIGKRGKNQIYCHVDKIKSNNSVNNIIITSRHVSMKLDYKTKVKKKVFELIQYSQMKRSEYIEKFQTLDKYGIPIKQICKVCNKDLPIINFNMKGKYHDNTCYECRAKKKGTININKHRESIKLAHNGLRRCSACKEIKKLDTDFGKNKVLYLGKENVCKKCLNNQQNKYRYEQKLQNTDYYIKRYVYGKYKIRAKDINKDDLIKYKNEYIESQKPKYHVDGLSFIKLKDFAEYMSITYSLPAWLIKKRIINGKSEEECKLSRHELRSQAAINRKRNDKNQFI